MPMLADYYTTHQWARELKRHGHRTMMAISFWLDDAEPVEVGRFFTPHKAMSASEAVKTLMETENRLGYQVVVRRAIGPREIRSVRSMPHVIGWRYYPEAHGRQSCMCDFCSRGNANRQRIKRFQDKRERLRRRQDT